MYQGIQQVSGSSELKKAVMPTRHQLIVACVGWALSLSLSTNSLGQQTRWWLNDECNRKIEGALCCADEYGVVIRESNGLEHGLGKSSLSIADSAYLDSHLSMVAAIKHFKASPYNTYDSRLKNLKRILDVQKIEQAYCKSLLTNSSIGADSDSFEDISSRWLEINGVQYRVVQVTPIKPVLGLESIVVAAGNGKQYEVPPESVKEFKLLPKYWNQYVSVSAGRDASSAFRRRGPPSRFTGLKKNEWKTKLAFDSISKTWTDLETASGNSLVAKAGRHWLDHKRLQPVTHSRWFVAKGNNYLSKKSLAASITEYSTAIQRCNANPDAYFGRGIAYLKIGGHDQNSVIDLTKAIEITSSELVEGLKPFERIHDVYGWRSKALLRQGRFDQAIGDSERAVELASADRKVGLRKLSTYVRQTSAERTAKNLRTLILALEAGESPSRSEIDDGLKMATNCVAYNPDPTNNTYVQLKTEFHSSASLHMQTLATASLKSGEFSNAIDLATTSVEFAPESRKGTAKEFLAGVRNDACVGYMDRALRLIEQGLAKEAIASAKSARELATDPTADRSTDILAQSYFLWGNQQYRAKKYSLAIASYNSVIEFRPRWDGPAFNLGLSHFQLHQFTKANAAFRKSLDINSENVIAWSLLAEGCLHLNQYQETIVAIDRAITLSPNNHEFLLLRAVANRQRGNNANAINDISNAIRISPTQDAYYQFRVRLYMDSDNWELALADAHVLKRSSAQNYRDSGNQLISRIAYLQEQERKADPYYMNEAGANDAIGRLVVAYLATIGERKLFESAERSIDEGTLGGAFFGVLKIGGGMLVGRTKDMILEDAIDDVWPNLSNLERSVATTLLSNIFREFDSALANGEDPLKRIGTVLGATGKDISRQLFTEWVVEQSPDLGNKIQIGSFLYDAVSAYSDAVN
jgi:tetratricopeptide (TPR) repeat protein